MVDNIRDLIDMWLMVGFMGVALATYGAAGLIFYEPRRS
jgi:hypothetical protein